MFVNCHRKWYWIGVANVSHGVALIGNRIEKVVFVRLIGSLLRGIVPGRIRTVETVLQYIKSQRLKWIPPGFCDPVCLMRIRES
jgi:hypothetical protein